MQHVAFPRRQGKAAGSILPLNADVHGAFDRQQPRIHGIIRPQLCGSFKGQSSLFSVLALRQIGSGPVHGQRSAYIKGAARLNCLTIHTVSHLQNRRLRGRFARADADEPLI